MTFTVKTKSEKMEGLALLPTIVVEHTTRTSKCERETTIQFAFWHRLYCVVVTKAIELKAIKA
jgi:hypothetical protein|nr:MAG TPA: hypothetical protein [Caudoviricetes sp.]